MAAQEKKAIATPDGGPSSIVVRVGKQVHQYLERGTLHLPADYSPDNALKSAWLILQEVRDKDQKPALQVCTQDSIMHALLDMVVQGLNPMKKQCYFIVYGNMLTCQRSYFGDIMLARRVCPGIQVYHGVVYEGDEFAYEHVRGKRVVAKHVQTIDNMQKGVIVAAYAGVVDPDGNDLGAEVMTIEQIKKAWTKSKTYGKSDKTPHVEYPDQMALRTVVRRRLKPIINSSTDELLMEALRRQEIEAAEAEVDEEIEAASAGQVVDAEPPALAEGERGGNDDQPAQEESADAGATEATEPF